MTAKFTTAELVAEALREVKRRKRIAGNRILTKRRTPRRMAREIELMQAIAEKLRRDELTLPF